VVLLSISTVFRPDSDVKENGYILGSMAEQQSRRDEAEVSVVRRSETSFFVHISGRKQFFNLEEMRALARICHAAGDHGDGARRIHRWLDRERRDVLQDAGIPSARDPRLRELYDIIVTTYKPRS